MSYGVDEHKRNIELNTLTLKTRAKFLLGELLAYRERMKALHRDPVLRVRHDDWLMLRDVAMKAKGFSSFDDLTLDGQVVKSSLDP